MKNIFIEGSAGKPIFMDVFLADNPQAPLVIFSHGFKGFKDWGAFNIVSESFAQQGISFLKFNFSYNGTTASDLFNFSDLEAFDKSEADPNSSTIGNTALQALQLKFFLSCTVRLFAAHSGQRNIS